MQPISNITTAAPADIKAFIDAAQKEATALEATAKADRNNIALAVAELARRAALPQFPAPIIGVNGILPPAGTRLQVWQPFPGLDRAKHKISTTIKFPDGSTQTFPDGASISCITAGPGAYTVAQTIDGQARAYTVTLTAPPRTTRYVDFDNGNDANAGTSPLAPKKTTAGLSSHTILYTAGTFTHQVVLDNLEDVQWLAQGTTTAATTVPGAQFTTNAASKNIVIRGIHANGPVQNDFVATLHGENIAIADFKLGNLNDGIQVNVCNGVLFQNVTEDSAVANTGRSTYIVAGSHVHHVDCSGLGSSKEITERVNGMNFGYYLRCSYAQPAATGFKSPWNIRQGSDIDIVDSMLIDGQLSLHSGGGEGGAPTNIVRTYIARLTTQEGQVSFGAGTQGATLLDSAIVCINSEGIQIAQGPTGFPYPTIGVVIANTTIRSDHKAIKTYGTIAVGKDVLASGVTYTVPNSKTPFATDGSNNPIAAASFGAANIVKVGA